MTCHGLILCVEDEPAIRRDIADELRDAGFEVLEAANGREGLDLIHAQKPDLVLTDVNMPEVTGFQLLETLRRDSSFDDVPVILLTAFGDKNSQLRGRGMGADDYLVKPIDYDLLLATVRGRLSRLRQVREKAEAGKQELEQLVAMLMHQGELPLPDRTSFLHDMAEMDDVAGSLVLCVLDDLHRLRAQASAEAGTEVLLAFTRLLESTFGAGAKLYHLGGEEFAVLVRGKADHQLTRAAEQVVQSSMQLGLRRIDVTATVALASWTADHDRGLAGIFDDARLAVTQSRRQGGRALTVLDDPAVRSLRISHFVETNFRAAIEGGELSLHYQPKLRLSDNKIIGAEALLRWNNPQLGPISPGVFIPVAERCGAIHELSNWVIEHAVRDTRRLHEAGAKISVALNASAADFQAGLADRIRDAMAVHHVDPDWLEVEITETSMVSNPAKVTGVIGQLRALGVRIAVDDFGTGYSSFSYLRDFPLDVVKVDQTYIRGLADGPTDYRIVESVVSLARTLGFKTVAEGVETKEQLALLTKLGCDVVQGYLIARPMPFDQFVAFLAKGM